jgi:hypothetical protein
MASFETLPPATTGCSLSVDEINRLPKTKFLVRSKNELLSFYGPEPITNIEKRYNYV